MLKVYSKVVPENPFFKNKGTFSIVIIVPEIRVNGLTKVGAKMLDAWHHCLKEMRGKSITNVDKDNIKSDAHEPDQAKLRNLEYIHPEVIRLISAHFDFTTIFAAFEIF